MRRTDDSKEYIVKARINESMHKHIKEKAYKQGKKMSEIIRQLILRDMTQFYSHFTYAAGQEAPTS